MTYDPLIHHRRSIRLKGYDYSQAGCYFITICCQNRICRFGHIENSEMQLNEFGQIAHREWERLADRFPNFELDVFQIMPNHVHGIIALHDPTAFDKAASVSNIVCAYKSLVANKCLEIYKSRNEIMGKWWQRDYYERIIWNERAYEQIAQYIMNNPAQWQTDRFR